MLARRAKRTSVVLEFASFTNFSRCASSSSIALAFRIAASKVHVHLGVGQLQIVLLNTKHYTRSATRLLRDRHGRTLWWPEDGWRLRSYADHDGHCHGMDRVRRHENARANADRRGVRASGRRTAVRHARRGFR